MSVTLGLTFCVVAVLVICFSTKRPDDALVGAAAMFAAAIPAFLFLLIVSHIFGRRTPPLDLDTFNRWLTIAAVLCTWGGILTLCFRCHAAIGGTLLASSAIVALCGWATGTSPSQWPDQRSTGNC